MFVSVFFKIIFSFYYESSEQSVIRKEIFIIKMRKSRRVYDDEDVSIDLIMFL
jgi:hypothetical protein